MTHEMEPRIFAAIAEAAEQLVASGRIRLDDNSNPFPVIIAGEHWHVCGPTTGEWLAANDLREVIVIDDITFAR